MNGNDVPHWLTAFDRLLHRNRVRAAIEESRRRMLREVFLGWRSDVMAVSLVRRGPGIVEAAGSIVVRVPRPRVETPQPLWPDTDDGF